MHEFPSTLLWRDAVVESSSTLSDQSDFVTKQYLGVIFYNSNADSRFCSIMFRDALDVSKCSY